MNRSVIQQIMAGAKSVRGSLNPTETFQVAVRVFKANPRNIGQFAFVAGRNAAISEQRHLAAKSRMREEEHQRALREYGDARRAWEQARDLEAAQEQFAPFVATIPKNPHCLTQDAQVEAVRLQVIEGCSYEQISAAFPGATEPQMWQWKRRGVKLLLHHNPPAQLRRVLEASLNNKEGR